MAFELITVGKGNKDDIVVVKHDGFYIRISDRQITGKKADVSVDKDNKLFKIEFTPNGQRTCSRVGVNRYKVSCIAATSLIKEWWGGGAGKQLVLDTEFVDENTIILKGALNA